MDLTLVLFHAPDKARNETLMMQSMFRDGVRAFIVGMDPMASESQP